MLTLVLHSLEPLCALPHPQKKPLRTKNRFNRNSSIFFLFIFFSYFFAQVYTEHFATVKEILSTNIMVCHHSVTAALNNALWHPAERIVPSESNPQPNLQITPHFKSEVCTFVPAVRGMSSRVHVWLFNDTMPAHGTDTDVSVCCGSSWWKAEMLPLVRKVVGCNTFQRKRGQWSFCSVMEDTDLFLQNTSEAVHHWGVTEGFDQGFMQAGPVRAPSYSSAVLLQRLQILSRLAEKCRDALLKVVIWKAACYCIISMYSSVVVWHSARGAGTSPHNHITSSRVEKKNSGGMVNVFHL